MRDGGRVLVETPQDVNLYGLPRIREWVEGVTWHQWVQTDALAAVLDDINVPALYRCYWGMWVAQTPTKCSFRSGAVTYLRPYGSDAVRAHLILQRVRRKLASVEARYRYVDSVIVPAGQVIPTGDATGDWREVRRYNDGVWIGWPGAYGPAHGTPDRQAGVPRVRTA
jgi:hypothetical protein